MDAILFNFFSNFALHIVRLDGAICTLLVVIIRIRFATGENEDANNDTSGPINEGRDNMLAIASIEVRPSGSLGSLRTFILPIYEQR